MHVDHAFFENYLGMRVETIDMTEILRRIECEIFDPEEYQRALAWTKEHCLQGTDVNSEEATRSAESHLSEWEASVKMALICRDLMVGNDRLNALGYKEEARGHNAIASGFQGQRQWTDHFPNGDLMMDCDGSGVLVGRRRGQRPVLLRHVLARLRRVLARDVRPRARGAARRGLRPRRPGLRQPAALPLRGGVRARRAGVLGQHDVLYNLYSQGTQRLQTIIHRLTDHSYNAVVPQPSIAHTVR